jgi:DNA primase
MKWMKERDLLIAQTMAFVQSVTGKRPDADKLFAKSAAPAAPDAVTPVNVADSSTSAATYIPDIEALLADTTVAVTPLRAVQLARPDIKQDFQSEIRARVANFRAHQERFNRERQAYCSATMAKVHASLREDGAPPRLGK